MPWKVIFSFFILGFSFQAQANPILEFPVKSFQQNISNPVNLYQGINEEYYCSTKDGLYQLISGGWERIYKAEKELKLISDHTNDQLIVAGDGFFSSLSFNNGENPISTILSENLNDDLLFESSKAIVNQGDKTYIQVDQRLLEVGNEIIDFGFDDILFLTSLNGDILIQRENLGLFLFVGNDFKKVNGSENYAEGQILSIVNLPRSRHLIIYKNAWIVYDGEHFTEWTSKKIRSLQSKISSVTTNPQGIFIGTKNDGIIQLSFSGEEVRRISVSNGLFSDNIRFLFTDQNENIWAGSEKGVNHIMTNSSFQIIPSNLFAGPNVKLAGTVINSVGQDIFIGTEEGIYKFNGDVFDNITYPRFQKIRNNKGLVRQLNTIDDLCFASGENGFSAIVNNSAYQISPNLNSNGALLLKDNDVLIESNKEGLNLYERNQRKWRFSNKLYGVNEEISALLQDQSNKIWALGASSGILFLDFNSDLNTIEAFKYKPDSISTEEIYGLYLINGKPIITTSKGIFEYDLSNDRFKANTKFNVAFGPGNQIKFLFQDKDENIWFISDTESGVLLVEDNGIEKSVEKLIIPELFPILNKKDPAMFELGVNKLIASAKDGFIYLDKSGITKAKSLTIKLIKYSTVDSEDVELSTFIANSSQIEGIEETARNSNFFFQFGSNYKVNEELVEYSFRLNDGEWSGWKKNNKIKQSFLKGENTLQVRARIGQNHLSNVIEIPVSIRKSWWTKNVLKTIIYFIVGLLVFSLFAILTTKQRKKIKEKDLELNQSKASLKNLYKENETLKENIDMLSAKILSSPEEKDLVSLLKDYYKESDDPELRKGIKKVIKKIQPENSENAPKPLIANNPEFDSKLKLKFPELTKKDIRLCNYLRLKLSSKEIAPLLGISIRGVEISRYRLRKKLGLANDENLPKFLKKLYKADV